jgi:putative protease
VLTAHGLFALGLKRLTPTHDLNAAQVAGLARAIGADKLEVIAWQHLPVFHMEHCVFCRFLSNGTSYENCGHPCEKHRVALRDTDGRAHPVMADVGCRNTVFGAEAQEASRYLRDWRDAGIEHYRLEFVHETADQVVRIANAFYDALIGQAGPRRSKTKTAALLISGNDRRQLVRSRKLPRGSTPRLITSACPTIAGKRLPVEWPSRDD